MTLPATNCALFR